MLIARSCVVVLVLAACSSEEDGGVDAALSATSQGVIGVNDAPILDTTKFPHLGEVDEDAPAPVGPVGSLVSMIVDYEVGGSSLDNVSDPDIAEAEPSALGIAITSAPSTNGTWFFTIDDGATWTPLGTVGNNSARLLAAAPGHRLYFQPTPNYEGGANITFRAWDQTTGTDGGGANTTTNGGTTAFSSSSDVATILVAGINDAPMLDVSKSPTLTMVTEDAPAPSGAVGTLVSALIDDATQPGGLDNVTDIDELAGFGMAIVNVDPSGSWFYTSNNGITWTPVPALAPGSALLLAAEADSRIYFQPPPDATGSIPAAITFHAWDRSSFASGSVVTMGAVGGTTSFSADSDVASIEILPVNDAPVLDLAKTPVLSGVEPNAPAPSGAVGTPVDQLVDLSNVPGGLDNVFDPDVGAVAGIAIIGAQTTNGTWWYTIDNGATWSAMGSPSSSSARLLAGAGARLYFQPNAGFSGTIVDVIAFRAWDTTLGTNGGTALVVNTGGTTAFSNIVDTASITVATNPPMATNLSAAETYTEDTPLDLIDIVVSDPDTPNLTVTLTFDPTRGSLSTATAGTTTSTFSGGTWTASGPIAEVNMLLANVTFTPATNSSASFVMTTHVTDGTTELMGSKPFSGVDVNDAPMATNLSAPEVYDEDTALDLVDIVVSDPDSATITATLTLAPAASGALTTATSGSTTSTYDSASGVWTASGPLAEVNALLAGVTLVPDTGYTGAFTIATSVSDGVATPITGTKNVTSSAVDDPPSATNLSAAETFTEDEPLDLVDIVVTDDSPTITATLTLSITTAGELSAGTSGGGVATFANGVWSATGTVSEVNALLAEVVFTPAPNFMTSFTIATSVSDGTNAAVTGSKAMTAVGSNDAPIAADDSATVVQGQAVDIAVLVNDSEPDGETPEVEIVTQPAHGTVTVAAGIVTYTHDGGDATSDSFTYQLRDAANATSSPATVSITITPAPSDPEPDPEPSGDDGGCGCQSSSPASSAWLVLVLGVVIGRRRRATRR